MDDKGHDIVLVQGSDELVQGSDELVVLSLDELIKRLGKENAELRAVVDKYPKTADGEPACPGMNLWYEHPGSGKMYRRTYNPDLDDAVPHRVGYHETVWIDVQKCYSSLESLEAGKAKNGKNGGNENK